MKLCVLTILLASTFAMTSARGDEIKPSTNLVVEGIPPIPDSLARDVGRYTKGRSANLLGWHPLRREMLIATYFGTTPQVHQVKSPGGARTQLTFFDDRCTRGVSYQPTKGDYFIFSKDVGGNQNSQNYRYDLATGDITLLTDGKSRNSAGVWSCAGDRIVYGSTRRTGKDVDLYVLDPLRPQTDRMLAQLEGGGWIALDWSPDDRQILAVQHISANESSLWLVDATTGEKSLFSPKGDTEKVAQGRFSEDGKGVYIITDRGSEFRRLAFVDVATKQYKTLTGHIDWDVTELDPSPDGKLLAIVTNEDGVTRLHVLDAVSGKERPFPQLPVGYFTSVLWHQNGHDLGFNLDSAKLPADVYSLDVTTGSIERWTYSETGGLNTQAFTEPELVRWKTFDGRMLSGFLYRPPARFTGKRPVVVDIHGGPENQFQPYFMDQQRYYLDELGVALLYPNIRGSSGFGKAFLKLDNGLLREDAYRDIGTLLDWIKTQPTLDGDRIMVTGVSYGGNVTLVVASRFNDRIRCAIDIVGPSNLVTFLENTAPYRQDLRRVEYGDERDPKTRAFLEKIAPINNAARITKPLFVVQGENDPIVPVSQSEQMVATVRKNGTPVWYLKGKNEGHGFGNRENSDFEFYATVLFMKTYLLPE